MWECGSEIKQETTEDTEHTEKRQKINLFCLFSVCSVSSVVSCSSQSCCLRRRRQPCQQKLSGAHARPGHRDLSAKHGQLSTYVRIGRRFIQPTENVAGEGGRIIPAG